MGFAILAAVQEPRVAPKHCIGFSCLCEPASHAEHDAGCEAVLHFDLAAAAWGRVLRRLTLRLSGRPWTAKPAVGCPLELRVSPRAGCPLDAALRL